MMKCLFIVGVWALFVTVNAKNILSKLDDEKVEELELNEDDFSAIDKIARAVIPSFLKPGTPISNPVKKLNFCTLMQDIIHVIRFNRRVGMEMFKQFIADAMQTIVDEIVGYPKGWGPTRPPTKKPSGAAHTRPHSNGPSGGTIRNGPSGGTVNNGPSESRINNANDPTSSGINKLLRRRGVGFHQQGDQNDVDQETARHLLGNKNVDLEQIVGDERVGRK